LIVRKILFDNEVARVERYTVYEVANILKISHQTIYNKLKNKAIFKELKQFIKQEGKHKYISVEGIEVLKKHLNVYKKMDNDFDNVKPADNDMNVDNEHLRDSKARVDIELIDNLKSQIEYLKEHTKQQLEAKDKQIDNLMRLNENNQSLLMQTQKKIELLEENNQSLLIQTQRKIELLESESSRANKSIWSRIWK